MIKVMNFRFNEKLGKSCFSWMYSASLWRCHANAEMQLATVRAGKTVFDL